MFLLTILLSVEIFNLTFGHVITSAPILRFTEPASLNVGEHQGKIPNQWLGKREETDCDGIGSWTCPTASGTCYTGGNGYIGCCSVSNCAPRTTCMDFTNGLSNRCDPDTEGCIACSKESPACVRITNVLEDQFIMYCAATATTQTTSYRNLKVVSTTTSPLPTSSAAASSTTTEAASTVTVELSLNPLVTSTSTSASTITVISSTYSPTATTVRKHHLSPGAIAGIAIAAVLGIATISALIFYCIICIRRNRDISNAGGFSSDKPSPGLKSPSLWAKSLWGKKPTPSASARLDTGLGISTNPSNHRNGAHPATPELPETPRSAELPSEADGDSPREPLHPYAPATAYQPMPTMAEESSSAYPMAASALQQQLRPQSRQRHQPASSQYIAYSPHHHNSLPVSEMSTPTNPILEANRPSTGFAIDSGFGTPNDAGNVREREHRVSATEWEGGYIMPETVMADGWMDEYPRAYGQVRRS